MFLIKNTQEKTQKVAWGSSDFTSRSWEHVLQSAIELHCSSDFCVGMKVHQILRTVVSQKCPQITAANIILTKLLQIEWSPKKKAVNLE